MSKHINTVGASYLAVNFLGWATATSPWGALGKLELAMSSKRITVGSDQFKKCTDEVYLYYLPDESKFEGTNNYAPIDKDGNPYGIPLYAGTPERHQKSIKEILNPESYERNT